MDTPHKKSLREVLPKKTTGIRRSRAKNDSLKKDEIETDQPNHSLPASSARTDSYRLREFSQRGSSKKSRFIVLGISGIIVLFVGGTILFQHATINVQTRTEEALINDPQTIVALANTGDRQTLDENNTASSSTKTTPVYFGLIQKTISATTSVKSSGTKKVSQKAAGQITIYNNFSSANQPLVTSTRFETKDGKIYKLDKAVTVPGLKGGTPGTITVSVTAEAGGEDYNIPATDFTIPGFKGGAKYTKIYGKSTSPMTGGLIGDQPVVTADDKTKAEQVLKDSLAEEIGKLTNNQIPPGYILLDGAQLISYNDSKQTVGNANVATLTQSAVVTLVLLDRSSLGQYLVKGAITDYRGEPVDIKIADNLKVTVNTKEKLDLDTTQKISLSLKGKATLIWILDKEDLKKALAGLTEKSYPAALAKFPSISKSSISFTPPWFRYLPKNINRITVTTDTDPSN